MLKKYLFRTKPRLGGVLLEVVGSTVVDDDVADEASEAEFLELSVASSTNITDKLMKYPIKPELEQKHARELLSLLNDYSDVFSNSLVDKVTYCAFYD